MEEQAKKAGEELDKARQAQQRNNDREAEKHLKNALDRLGQEQQQPNQKQDREQNQNKDRKDQAKPESQPQDKQLPKSDGQQKQAPRPEPEKEIDKDQAKTLLDLMAGDEKKLKDELKERMKRNYGTRPVDKDW